MAVSPDLLAHTACFARLSRATVARVAGMAELRAHAPGHLLYTQGDASTGLHILQAGRVKLFRQSGDRVQILALPLPGECFGAETLAGGNPSPFTAMALSAVTTIYVSPEDVRELVDTAPDFQDVLLQLVSARLRQFVSLVHDLAFRDVTARLAMLLVKRAAEEGRRTDRGICIERLLSQQDFAAMVGTAREVIYRTFKKFEQDGLLQLSPQHITILDLARLEAVAAQEAR